MRSWLILFGTLDPAISTWALSSFLVPAQTKAGVLAPTQPALTELGEPPRPGLWLSVPGPWSLGPACVADPRLPSASAPPQPSALLGSVPSQDAAGIRDAAPGHLQAPALSPVRPVVPVPTPQGP